MNYDLINLDLNTLPKVSMRNRRGIYFLYDKNELVYIGQSIFIQRRVIEHFLGTLNGIPIKHFDSYRYLEITEDESLDKLEIMFILEYKPKYNKNNLGLSLYGTKRKSRAKPVNELKNKKRRSYIK